LALGPWHCVDGTGSMAVGDWARAGRGVSDPGPRDLVGGCRSSQGEVFVVFPIGGHGCRGAHQAHRRPTTEPTRLCSIDSRLLNSGSALRKWTRQRYLSAQASGRGLVTQPKSSSPKVIVMSALGLRVGHHDSSLVSGLAGRRRIPGVGLTVGSRRVGGISLSGLDELFLGPDRAHKAFGL
jgi:hypothetical protein